jgi:hypothetical protein
MEVLYWPNHMHSTYVFETTVSCDSLQFCRPAATRAQRLGGWISDTEVCLVKSKNLISDWMLRIERPAYEVTLNKSCGYA